MITWNIRLTPFVAGGLGLPEEAGKMTKTFHSVRQNSEIVKDYFKECIKTLITTYENLAGIGTNCAEVRHKWGREVYIEAIKDSGRNLPFIIRTNMGNGKIAKDYFIDPHPGKENYISWKYSNAHMYSHYEPKFEELWGAWKDVNMEEISVFFEARNDDYHTFRAGSPEFISNYFKKMAKPYVNGFYWGADGYLWGEDFQHIQNNHKIWQYDFEKHWFQFELLGRLSFNPDLDEDIWIKKFEKHYGEKYGKNIYEATKMASDIIPAINRLFWRNYDYQWHPESLLSVSGFTNILEFIEGKSTPGSNTISIKKFISKKLNNENIEGETPEDILNIINKSIEIIDEKTSLIKKELPDEYFDGDIKCVILDLEAWKQLGSYYLNKFNATINLTYYKKTDKKEYKARAIQNLEEGINNWQKLSTIWSSHYLPYKMTRTKQLFGYPYYIDQVKKDVKLAENF